jgi:ADP-heptose:LPS heptosyltransferase
MNETYGPNNGDSPVVVIRLRGLGDVLATLDALRALKEARPDREVIYVVDQVYHPLLENEDYIDRLLPSPPRVGSWSDFLAYVRYVRSLRKLRPGVVLDYHSNARSAFLSLLSGAKSRVGFDVKVRKIAYNVVEPRAEFTGAGIVYRNSAETALRMARHAGADGRKNASLPRIEVDHAALEHGKVLLNGAGVPRAAVEGHALVGLNPGRAHPTKEWPESHFVELARALVERGVQVVVLWGPGEREIAERVAGAVEGAHVGPDTSLAELPGLLANLSYVVTIDSGLKHLAACVRVSTVTIFGSTSPREWHIGTERDGHVWRGYSCSPCRLLACPYGAPCLSDIKPQDVLGEIDRLNLDGDTR